MRKNTIENWVKTHPVGTLVIFGIFLILGIYSSIFILAQ